MLAADRQQRILKMLQQRGFVEVADLSSAFEVTPMTIRRDLDKLGREGLLERTHGGAVPAKAFEREIADDPPYELKKKKRRAEKERIGSAAAGLVDDGDVVIVDSGSTTLWLARAIHEKRDLTIVSNDLPNALELSAHSSCQLILLGGNVRPGIFSTWGPYTEYMLREISADKFFMSADAVDLERGVLNATAYEANVKRLMVEAVEKVYLLVDSTKFQKTALVRVCDWDDIDEVVTDSELPEEILKAITSKGVHVRIT